MTDPVADALQEAQCALDQAERRIQTAKAAISRALISRGERPSDGHMPTPAHICCESMDQPDEEHPVPRCVP